MKKISTAIVSVGILLISATSVFAENITINTSAPTKIVDLGSLLSATVSAVLIISALAAFIYLIWGGIQWITSGGDKSATEAARNRIQAAILGLFIVFAAWAIMLTLGKFFDFDISKLEFKQPF
ncbi:hypothetical protein HY338_03480 [Candidatus Gottesmanbacteria bacterium]|nr:hypothetical protein [Candidatus Gottesmanbacteria bacterium]